MKQQQLLDLIQASQTVLKQELILEHPESKYQLLMLSRSFDLLKHYISQQNQAEDQTKAALEQYFQLPILDVDEAIKHLAQDLRHHLPKNTLPLLKTLNQSDLMITHPKLISSEE